MAGKRAEQQWREHLEHEEEERQAWFDRRRLAQHRAIVARIATTRSRYERATNETTLARARMAVRRSLERLEKQVTKLDPWGNNSRVLPNYRALLELLAGGYPDARLAALQGDTQRLDRVRAVFDRQMETIEEWLKEAEHSEYD